MKDRIEKRIKRIRRLLDHWGIAHFDAEEVVRHHDDAWDGPDLYPPPKRLATNLEYTIKLADRIREEWGGPVRVLSGYRCPRYNDLIDGAEDSQHMYARALDIRPVDGRIETFTELVGEQVSEERGERSVGYGQYSSFIHIDTGHYDHQRNWDRR